MHLYQGGLQYLVVYDARRVYERVSDQRVPHAGMSNRALHLRLSDPPHGHSAYLLTRPRPAFTPDVTRSEGQREHGATESHPEAAKARLEQRDVVAHLINRGVLTPDRVVNESIRVVDSSRRNRTYRVETDSDPSFLVKTPQDAGGAATLAMEAKVLRALGSNSRLRTPEFFDWDELTSTLVVRLIDGNDLRAVVARTPRLPKWIAVQTGLALRALHSIDPGTGPWATFNFPHAHPPWIVDLEAPDLSLESTLSGANLSLLRIAQSSGIAAELGQLRELWRQDRIVHYDIRWDNWIVPMGGRAVVLVDLELTAPGDPAWDLGCAFEGFLSAWIDSMPLLGSVRPDQLVALASRPLDRFKNAIATTWGTYSAGGGLEPSILDRSVRWCAAKLVQSAYERSQNSWDLSGHALLMLQLALNLLRRPTEGRVQLLGLP